MPLRFWVMVVLGGHQNRWHGTELPSICFARGTVLDPEGLRMGKVPGEGRDLTMSQKI